MSAYQDYLLNNKSHNKRISKFISLIEEIFDVSTTQAIKMAESVNYDATKMFKFSDYPQLKGKVKAFVSEFQKQIKLTIVNGVAAEWEQSNINNTTLVNQLLMLQKINNDKSYFNNNQTALDAFLRRKTKGMDLSDRVWKLTQQYKEGLELALSVGLSEGKSAKDLSKDVRTYLREPAKLFRKVRDLEGNLNLSKPAKLYNPGAGVYRSSYKNAIRLTGTEINMAYRSADFIRWNQLKFVVGIQVKLSDNHTIKDPKTGKPRPFIDICDKLQGKYPKTFEFKGWHPNCRCFAIPILKTDDEFYGKTKESKNEVKELPDNFKTWHQDNQERMKNAKSLPYFLKDNEALIKNSL